MSQKDNWYDKNDFINSIKVTHMIKWNVYYSSVLFSIIIWFHRVHIYLFEAYFNFPTFTDPYLNFEIILLFCECYWRLCRIYCHITSRTFFSQYISCSQLCNSHINGDSYSNLHPVITFFIGNMWMDCNVRWKMRPSSSLLVASTVQACGWFVSGCLMPLDSGFLCERLRLGFYDSPEIVTLCVSLSAPS